DRRAGVRRDVLEAGRVRGGRGYDRRVLHRVGPVQRRLHRGDRRALLADRDVDAADLLLRVAAVPELLLVDDRVDRDRGLAGLAVADDQLPLAAADRRHRVDRLEAGLQRLVDLLAIHHAGRLQFQRAALVEAGDLTEPVDRVPQRVDHAAQVPVADG